MAKTCGPPDGIGSLTSPCQGGCGVRPPMPRRLIADRVSTTRNANGQTVLVRLDSIPDRDHLGRIAHVVGFDMVGSIDLETTNTTNTAVSQYEIQQKLSSIFLEDVTGHQYLSAADGRNLVDDIYFRNLTTGHLDTLYDDAGYQLATNVGTAQNNSVSFVSFFPFLSLSQGGRPSFRGAIPLKALKDRGDQGFRFTVKQITGKTNVTDNGFEATLGVYVWVVYLPALYVDSGWQLETYTIDDVNGRLWHADRMHEYVAIRPYLSDGDDLTAYTGITIQAGNDPIVSGYSVGEMGFRQQFVFLGDKDSVRADNPGGDSGTDDRVMMLLPRVKTRKAMASGPVTFSYATRTDASTRYLHRTVLCQSGNRSKEIARSVLGCDPTSANVKAALVDEEMRATNGAVDPGGAMLLTHR